MSSLRDISRSLISLSISLAAAALLAGCSSSFAPDLNNLSTEKTQVGAIQGMVHGGQFAVTGAKIFLLEAGNTGYGSAAKSLITSGYDGCLNSSGTADNGGNYAPLANACYVLTYGPNGNFSLGGDYTCDAGRQVYMVGMAGNPGSSGTFSTNATFAKNSNNITLSTAASGADIPIGASVSGTGIASGSTVTGVNGTSVTINKQTTLKENGAGVSVTFTYTVSNPYLVQMAGLGECPSSGGSMAQVAPYVTLNEISTVVFAYTMAPFESGDEFHIGGPSTTAGKQAIHNAMANFGNIDNLGYGQVPTTTLAAGSQGKLPVNEIYYLANILASCVNTSGGTLSNPSSSCTALFTQTIGTTGDPDESQAIFEIAQNPTGNVQNIYNLEPRATVFTASFGQPTDWTLPIIYSNVVSTITTGGGSVTSGPFNIAFDSNGTAWIGDRKLGVVEITQGGVVSTYNHSFGMIKGVAVDASNNIWATDYSNNKVYQISPTGTVSNTITGLNGPSAVALDASGNIFVANEDAGSVSVYNSARTLKSTTNVNVDTPSWIALDTSGNAWLPSTDNGNIGELKSNGNYSYTGTTVQANGLGGAYGIALNSSGYIWTADATDSQLYWLTPCTGFGCFGSSWTAHHQNQGGGLNTPHRISVDGNGTIWMPNEGTSTVTGWSASGAWIATNGLSTSDPGNDGAVDVAADLSGDLWIATMDKNVVELIGAAGPTVAPLSPATAGTKP